MMEPINNNYNKRCNFNNKINHKINPNKIKIVCLINILIRYNKIYRRMLIIVRIYKKK